MKSAKRGTPASEVEITNISPHGVWILLRGRELFLPIERFPWFKDATVNQVCKVELARRTPPSLAIA
jgi:hypothetical protein